MDLSEGRTNDYLLELYKQTDGDMARQVSMHDVGASVGMGKNEAGTLAEQLIMEELVELKTLSGGVGITSKGLDILQETGLVNISSSANIYRLSGEQILNTEDQSIVKEILAEVKTSISQIKADYEVLEEIVVDIKTIEVQLLSNKPKRVIIREIFNSLQKSLNAQELREVTRMISAAID